MAQKEHDRSWPQAKVSGHESVCVVHLHNPAEPWGVSYMGQAGVALDCYFSMSLASCE